MRKLHALDEVALIEMGDFVGGMLKYLRAHPVRCVTVAGGIGKITKLAQGRLDLHSRRGAVDRAALAALAAEAGLPAAQAARIEAANTTADAFELAASGGIALGDHVASRAWAVAAEPLRGTGIALEIALFDSQGRLRGRAPMAPAGSAASRNRLG